jgi:hypothetical protein
MSNLYSINRDEAIARIRAGLKKRTGRSWSVKGGRGTAWGWITIGAPPKRLVDGYRLSDVDRAELAKTLGLPLSDVHGQGISVPASSEYYRAHVERAETGSTERDPKPYWD